MADNSYPIEVKLAPKSGWFTPAESNNYYAARYARNGITVHWWGDGTGADNHDNIVNYMNGQAAKGIKSVNYVLSDNKITMCVNPDDVAWASQGGNPTTISVETQPTLGDEGYKKWGWLVDQLEQRYNKPLALHRHSDWAQTACPGTINLDRIRAEADKWKRGEYDPKPEPAPTPVPAPQPQQPAFFVENIPVSKKKLNKDTFLWDLNQRTWTDIKNNPIAVGNVGATFETDRIGHHMLGGHYYLMPGSDNQGYNVVDCDDVPSDVPVSAPVPATPYQPPQGASNLPSGKHYLLQVPVEGYVTATKAGNHDSPVTTLPPGSYFVFKEYHGRPDLINITRVDGQPGNWINTADNVIPEPTVTTGVATPTEVPEPTPPETHVETEPVDTTASLKWTDTYTPFAKPVDYVAVKDIVVKDLSGQQPDVALPKYDPTVGGSRGKVKAYGRVTGADGILYYRLRTNNDPNFAYWYSVPILDPVTNTPLLLVVPTKPLQPVTKADVVHDALRLAQARIEKDVPKFLDDIMPKWLKAKK